MNINRYIFRITIIIFILSTPIHTYARTVNLNYKVYNQSNNKSLYLDEKESRYIYWQWVNFSVFRAGVRNKMSDKKAVKKMSKWICKHTKYKMGEPDNAEGATLFIKGTGVCRDYADAFWSMCKVCGIPCYCYIGFVDMGDGTWGYHEWNRVKINKKWYWIDLTWYDATGCYYLRKKIWKDHKILRKQKKLIETSYVDYSY